MWYMRGSITLEEVFMLAYEDRQMISKIIKENIEATKKSGMPLLQAFCTSF